MLRKMQGVSLGLGEAWAFASAMVFALGNVLTRIVSVGGDAIAGSLLRTVPIILLSLVLMGRRYKESERLFPRRERFLGWRSISILAIYTFVISPIGILGLYLAFRYGGVLVAAPVLSLHPLWGALIAGYFLKEAFNRRIAGGIIASIVGIALLTYGQHTGTPVSPQWPLGVAYGLFTSLGFALGANFMRYLLSSGLNLFWLVGLSNTGGALVLLVLLILQGHTYTLGQFSVIQLGQLAAAGGLSGLGSLTLAAAMALTTVASATTLKSADVGIASLIAILFLGEAINLPVGLGILLIIGGVLVVQSGKAPATASGEITPLEVSV